MSKIQELSLNEILSVSGGGRNGSDASERHYGYNTSGGVNGGRSNYPNYNGVVAGPGVANDLSPECIKAMGLGTLNVVAAGVSRSKLGFGSAVVSALHDIGNTCNKPGSRGGPPFH